MQDLRVIGVENGALLVTSEEGVKFRIPIDEVMQAKLRQAIPDPGSGRKLAPREIQAHIRSGMSAQDVASVTGVPLEYIQKFEGPVLAERDFVVNSALNVPVHTAMETEPLGGSTFGTVIRERLYDLGAVDERWASWKEVGGDWVVKLAFTAEQIERDARWHFDPKKAALAPLNNEAITLSQQGDVPGSMVPRLRAVSDEERQADQSRFDSGAFSDDELVHSESATRLEAVPYGRIDETPPAVSEAAINRAPVDEAQSNQTADLLEALRRRRGERESASFGEDEKAAHPSTGTIRLVDIPLDPIPEQEDNQPGNTAPQPNLFQPRSGRKGRASMPSWDEIVFGARSDDDL
ncbi:MAG: hypothetical protein JWM49_76 [Microbacteriaceae bacterium]|jgi:hypothetical protein|nr:hypothetical protein [Microbacteriaceae bacterium]